MQTPRPRRALAIARGAATMLGDPVRVGSVQSVFRRAANLWVPPETLLAITAPAAMRVPNGIVVAAPAGPEDDAFLGIRVAMTVWVGDGLIRIPAAGICIDTVEVPLWDPRPRFPARPIVPALLDRNLARLAWLIRGSASAKRWSFASVLDPLARHESAADALGPGEEAHRARLVRRARPAVAALLSGIEACETGRVADAARRLAGLGHGLTPSGDDFLIGVCGALALAEAALPPGAGAVCRQAGSRQDHAAAIGAAADGTTLLSAVWLRHAARGEFSAEVGNLFVSLAEANATGLDGAAARLLAVGGLSGHDTAMGALLGSRAVLASLSPSQPLEERRGAVLFASGHRFPQGGDSISDPRRHCLTTPGTLLKMPLHSREHSATWPREEGEG